MPEVRSFSDQIRDAIKECGMPVVQLAIKADVGQTTLFRFLAETPGAKRGGGLTTHTLDKLGAAMGLRVSVVKPAGRPKKAEK